MKSPILTPDEREDGIAELIETTQSPTAAAADHQRRARAVTPSAGGSKTNRAEAYVLAHPGCTAEEVGEQVDQKPRTADGTLRHVATSRRSIERRDGKWYPTGKTDAKRQPSIREAILDVLADGQARGTAEIFAVLKTKIPGIKKPSVATTVMRLKGDVLVEKGPGPRGPLYGLASVPRRCMMPLARKKQNAMDLSVDEQKQVRAALRHLHARLGEWVHVSKVLHFARGTITDMVCGHAPVTASMAFRVARFLGAPIDDLLTGKFTPPSTCPYCKQPIPEDEVLR